VFGMPTHVLPLLNEICQNKNFWSSGASPVRGLLQKWRRNSVPRHISQDTVQSCVLGGTPNTIFKKISRHLFNVRCGRWGCHNDSTGCSFNERLLLQPKSNLCPRRQVLFLLNAHRPILPAILARTAATLQVFKIAPALIKPKRRAQGDQRRAAPSLQLQHLAPR
jgi:hypothetical protein